VYFDWRKVQLVTPAKRYQGQFIDGLIALALFISSNYLSKVFIQQGATADMLTIALPLIYFLLSDGLPNGQSIGKRIIGISVVNMNTGKACSFLGSFLRNAPSLFLGLIDAVLIVFRRRQRFGDILARTVVINGTPKF